MDLSERLCGGGGDPEYREEEHTLSRVSQFFGIFTIFSDWRLVDHLDGCARVEGPEHGGHSAGEPVTQRSGVAVLHASRLHDRLGPLQLDPAQPREA